MISLFCDYGDGSSCKKFDFPGESEEPCLFMDVISTKDKVPYISKSILFFDDGCEFLLEEKDERTEYVREWAVKRKKYRFELEKKR